MTTGHWEAIARQFQHAVPPHRPTDGDLATYRAAVDGWTRAHGRPPRAAILGVTPQLYALPWPEGTDLIAIDHTPDMIGRVWPGPPDRAILADWRDVDLPAASRDVAVSDGGMNMLPFPDGVATVCRKLADLLAPGGLFITRIYAPPAVRETPAAVLDDLRAGKVENLAALKTRLWMAVHRRADEPVAVADIWDLVHGAIPDLAGLEAAIGWPPGHLQALDTYRGSPNRYSFFRPDDLAEVFCAAPGGFTLGTVAVPDYPLGEMCPTLVFRRAGGPER